MDLIESAVIVVAHPDDEILWFSSILERCKRVIVCFGPTTRPDPKLNLGRAKLIEGYPLSKVKFLQVRSSDAYQSFHWRRPEVDDRGLIFRRERPLYANNSNELFSLLRSELENEEVVFTHNPWGEYGHEEHVQVFDVLHSLSEHLSFGLFVTGYVSNRSLALMSIRQNLLSADGVRLVVRETDKALANRMKSLYVLCDCWTWMDDYEWPPVELFYPVGKSCRADNGTTTASVPLNCISYNFAVSAPARFLSRALPGPVKKLAKAFMQGTVRPPS